MHVVLVIGLLGLLIGGSWVFRSESAVTSFLGRIVNPAIDFTDRLRQSATDEERNPAVESPPTETEEPAESPSTEIEEPAESPSTEIEEPAASSDISRQTLINNAREQLSDSPQEAVRIAYRATRRHFDSSDETTSREFYDNTRDRVSATDDLQRLVEIYEQAMFGEKIERDEAEKAVEAASTLISDVK